MLSHTLSARSNNSANATWVLDSGATDHMTPKRVILAEYVTISSRDVETANGSILNTNGKSKVNISWKGHSVTFYALYILRQVHNLLSCPRIGPISYCISMRHGISEIRREGTILLIAISLGSLS
jgi:hypothetical protein